MKNLLVLFSCLLFLFMTNACGPRDAKLDTSKLSESCRQKNINNQFVVKFKNDSIYKTIYAKDSADFESNFLSKNKETIEDYGLNFKFRSNQLDDLKTKKMLTTDWLRTTTRVDFLSEEGFLGQNVLIAILDTGLDFSQKQFLDNLVDSTSEHKLSNQDFNGHGTAMSSAIIGEKTEDQNQNFFYGGFAPEAKILPVKIFRNDTRTTDLSSVLNGLDVAIKNKVNIVNASWGGEENCSELLNSKLNELLIHDILFITSAGDQAQNLSDSPDYPASYDVPFMLVASSFNQFMEIPRIANFGGRVNIFAPGQDVPLIGLNGYVRTNSGTSIAAAYTSASAAVLKSAFPEMPMTVISSALSLGSKFNNTSAEKPLLDLKSSYYYLENLRAINKD